MGELTENSLECSDKCGINLSSKLRLETCIGRDPLVEDESFLYCC